VEGLIDFLEQIPNGQPFLARGSIAKAPVAFLTETFRQVEFSNPNPADFFRGYITLKERTAEECLHPNSGMFRHPPIHAEHLRANKACGAIRHPGCYSSRSETVPEILREYRKRVTKEIPELRILRSDSQFGR